MNISEITLQNKVPLKRGDKMKDCTSKICYVLEAKNCRECQAKVVRWYKDAIQKVIKDGLSDANCRDVSANRKILTTIGFEPSDMITITKEAKEEVCHVTRQQAS